MPEINLNIEPEVIKEMLLGDRDAAIQKIMSSVLDEILKAEATEQIKAQAYERSKNRTNSRNGYRIRQLTTRVGSLELHVPKLRHGNFSTQLFTRYQRSEQAFDLALMEMVIQGVSTRKVAAITKELCGTTFSKSTVSALCSRLDSQVLAFNQRSLSQKYAFMYADAMIFKVRREGIITSNSLLIAIGIDPTGHREVLGFSIGDSESEASWTDFFTDLKDRGLYGVEMVVSDAHCGLKHAIENSFQGAIWQRCQVHFSRDCLARVQPKDRKAVGESLRDMFNAPTYEIAVNRRNQLIENWQSRFPRVVKMLDRDFDALTNIYNLPEELRKRLRSNNTIERLNQEVRRRERVIRIFPNDMSVVRLLGSLLMEQNEKWTAGPRYLNMTNFQSIKKSSTSINRKQSPLEIVK